MYCSKDGRNSRQQWSVRKSLSVNKGLCFAFGVGIQGQNLLPNRSGMLRNITQHRHSNTLSVPVKHWVFLDQRPSSSEEGLCCMEPLTEWTTQSAIHSLISQLQVHSVRRQVFTLIFF